MTEAGGGEGVLEGELGTDVLGGDEGLLAGGVLGGGTEACEVEGFELG